MFPVDKKNRPVGSADKGGTRHFWHMTQTSVALCILLPVFLFGFLSIIGASYEEVRAFYAKPFNATIAILTFIIGFDHFNCGMRVVIEDYSRGLTRKMLFTVSNLLSYGAMAFGIVAVLALLARGG